MKLVRQRAGDCCEYCRLPQWSQEAIFHVDDVIPRAAKGPTNLDNLALACVTCSLKKAARTHAKDPQSGESVALFNPRIDDWHEHFRCRRTKYVGRTAVGRATLAALGMNRPAVIKIRRALVKLGSAPW
jgi:hypothetical protein